MPSRFLILMLLGVTALLLPPAIVQAGPVPNCVGTNACAGNTGDVGEGAFV